MDLLCELTDLVLENNPDIARKRRAESSQGRIRVVWMQAPEMRR